MPALRYPQERQPAGDAEVGRHVDGAALEEGGKNFKKEKFQKNEIFEAQDIDLWDNRSKMQQLDALSRNVADVDMWYALPARACEWRGL